MRLKINPLFFLFFPFLVFSQKTLSITVFDKVDKSPLKDIKILIDSEFVSTDEQGKFVIEVGERKVSLINFLFLKSRLLPIDEETGQNTQTRHFPIDHFYINFQFITSRALKVSF